MIINMFFVSHNFYLLLFFSSLDLNLNLKKKKIEKPLSPKTIAPNGELGKNIDPPQMPHINNKILL